MLPVLGLRGLHCNDIQGVDRVLPAMPVPGRMQHLAGVAQLAVVHSMLLYGVHCYAHLVLVAVDGCTVNVPVPTPHCSQHSLPHLTRTCFPAVQTPHQLRAHTTICRFKLGLPGTWVVRIAQGALQ